MWIQLRNPPPRHHGFFYIHHRSQRPINNSKDEIVDIDTDNRDARRVLSVCKKTRRDRLAITTISTDYLDSTGERYDF